MHPVFTRGIERFTFVTDWSKWEGNNFPDPITETPIDLTVMKLTPHYDRQGNLINWTGISPLSASVLVVFNS